MDTISPVFAVMEAGVDADYAALERAESLCTPATSTAPSGAVYRHRRTLAELPSSPMPVRSDAPIVKTVAHEAVETPSQPVDPLVHLRTARLGFALVVVLVLYGLWIWQRRRR